MAISFYIAVALMSGTDNCKMDETITSEQLPSIGLFLTLVDAKSSFPVPASGNVIPLISDVAARLRKNLRMLDFNANRNSRALDLLKQAEELRHQLDDWEQYWGVK